MRARKEKLENFSEKFLRVVFYFQNWKLQIKEGAIMSLFNNQRIENLESKFYKHVKEFHKLNEGEFVCYTKKDVSNGREIIGVAQVLKIFPLESHDVCSSEADVVIEDIVDRTVHKVGSNNIFNTREEAQLKADIVNIQSDIAEIKNKLTF